MFMSAERTAFFVYFAIRALYPLKTALCHSNCRRCASNCRRRLSPYLTLTPPPRLRVTGAEQIFFLLLNTPRLPPGRPCLVNPRTGTLQSARALVPQRTLNEGLDCGGGLESQCTEGPSRTRKRPARKQRGRQREAVLVPASDLRRAAGSGTCSACASPLLRELGLQQPCYTLRGLWGP